MSVYTSDNTLYTFKVADLVFKEQQNAGQNNQMDMQDGQQVVMKTEYIDAVNSDEMNEM